MKLNNKRTILVGLAFMSICAFWQVYDGIIPLILKNTFNIGDTASGVVMALDNVLALFMLPLFGAFSDRTHTKLGKRMPYIIGGTITACIFMLLIPLADQIYSLPLMMISLGAVLFAMATYRSPAVALMPDVTPTQLRSKGNAIINLMGAIGGIIVLFAVKILVPKTEHPSFAPLFFFTAAVMLICVAVLVRTINENKCVDEMQAQSREAGIAVKENSDTLQTREKLPRDVFKSLFFILASVFLWFMGYNAVTTAFSKYASLTWGMEGGDYAMVVMVAQAAAIASYIPVGILSTKFGRKKTILCGIVMLSVAFGAAIFFKTFSGMIFFFFSLAGIGWAFINVNSYPMVVEISRGSDIGKYTGYYYTFSMTAQIITPILSGAVMEFMGYRFLFPYGCFFVAASFITMLFVKHGDNRPQRAKSTLENFDVD
ncbi:MAG: MFS transporter [Oscillospiraceae bacterium]